MFVNESSPDTKPSVAPWGVHTIASIYHPGISAALPDGRWVAAVCQPYDGNRLKAAWWVLTGRAFALIWPKAGDIESALGHDGLQAASGSLENPGSAIRRNK
jgi:hypothetical protein